MTKLNQIIAIEKGIKSRAHSEGSELYKAVQKPALFNGFAKHYQANEEGGEQLPPESQRVQFEMREVIARLIRSTSELMQVTARKDWTNQDAAADITVNGKLLVPAAPVSYLLFLEKQLVDLRTFFEHAPILDEAETWIKDPNSGLYRTEVTKTHRTKKVQKPLVLYQATPEHPAQTQLVTEDVISGFWNTTKLSGAMPKPEKLAVIEKIDVLIKAVKEAREAANMQEEKKTPDVGSALFDFIFAKGE